jgi:hypothetical protein
VQPYDNRLRADVRWPNPASCPSPRTRLPGFAELFDVSVLPCNNSAAYRRIDLAAVIWQRTHCLRSRRRMGYLESIGGHDETEG